MQSWSFGILCFNEGATLTKVYQDVVALAESWQLEDMEILLVDDGSTDNTPSLIQELALKDDRVKAFLHPRNLGIGAGIRDIYFQSTRENVIFIPGDGQFDIWELQPYPAISEHTFLSFYRKENLSYSTFRNILSGFNKWFNRIFLGLDLKDVNWVKAYKREKIIHLDLRIKSSAIESEICAKLLVNGNLPHEIPSRYLPRLAGTSQGASLKTIFRVVKELFTLFTSVLIFRYSSSNKEPS
ncbi:MAG: glycosyltransferase family 2 protein [Saprospiraceae bacterium]|nr:glycosyltransferase family 2 protein [Saprospiraceae bacterium]